MGNKKNLFKNKKNNKTAEIVNYEDVFNRLREEYDEFLKSGKELNAETAAELERLKKRLNKLHAWGLTDVKKRGRSIF